MDRKSGFVFVVAAALVDPDGCVLLAQRPAGKAMGGLWEFPGGKVQVGETPEAALVRELSEELGIRVETCDLLPCGFTSWRYPEFHLFMPLFLCRLWHGEPQALEHESLAWAPLHDLRSWSMPDADVPLISQIEKLA